MLQLGGLFLGSLIALSGSAFAAQPQVTDTTRGDRMQAAQMDFESGKPAMTSPAPKAKPMHSSSKHHHTTKK
ncbi:hypothetical protein WKW79_02100 [Variovorax robiniae]|uniref:Pentapeptide MXKDX repeat protein n=1 Tax=Variovorax robiniae TaxID=1836199 RepID=A0ABU8X0Q2_9BURK